MLVCCKKTKEQPVDIVGDWKLESINGVPASSLATDGTGGLDIYVSFAEDNTFEIFQRLHDGKSYCRYLLPLFRDLYHCESDYCDGKIF